MIALAWVEARRSSRSVVLWLGLIAVAGVGFLNGIGYWPVVPLDVATTYEAMIALGVAVFLVGAWGGLRDKRHGTVPLLDATPSGLPVVITGRAAGIAVTSAAIAVLCLVAVSVLSVARGGGGAIAPGLLIAAAGLGAFFSVVGFATGTLTGSRVVSLFAGPIFAIGVFLMEDRLAVPMSEGVWLLPHLSAPEWYGPLGYLPDIWAIHGVYLFALAIAVTAGLGLVAARRGGAARAIPVLVAVLAVAATGVATSGIWLLGQPESVMVVGAEDWVSVDNLNSYDKAAELSRTTDPTVGNDSATTCASVEGFEACVYPEFGHDFAVDLARSMALLAPVADLPGMPSRAEMVPSYYKTCTRDTDGTYLIAAQEPPTRDPMAAGWKADAAFSCGIRQAGWNGAKGAIATWASIALTGTQSHVDFGSSRGNNHVATGLELAEMPVDEVVALLEPIWPQLRKGEVTMGELRELIEEAK